MRKMGLWVLAAVMMSVAPQAAVGSDKPSDAHALRGVTEGKVVWDISTPDPETLGVYLSVVRETYDDLVRQNVKPDMVLAIHGKPVRYVREDMSDLPLDSMPHIDRINEILDDLKGRDGVRIEVCSVANRLMGVKNAETREGLHVVGNTWVSLIGYQAQGYTLIPVF